MRGTELITLINKAIANNEKYDNEHEIYDVNIVFTLKSDVTEIEITVKDNKQIEVASDISTLHDVSGTDDCRRKVKTPKNYIFR